MLEPPQSVTKVATGNLQLVINLKEDPLRLFQETGKIGRKNRHFDGDGDGERERETETERERLITRLLATTGHNCGTSDNRLLI